MGRLVQNRCLAHACIITKITNFIRLVGFISELYNVLDSIKKKDYKVE